MKSRSSARGPSEGSRNSLSEADLRLTAKALRSYLNALEHNARHRGTTVRPGRVAQLERLELIYLELADARSRA